MKKVLLPLLLFVYFLASCTLPGQTQAPATTATPQIIVVTATAQPTPQPSATQQVSGVEKNLGGVDLILPPCLAADASGVIVPEENPGNNGPVFGYIPEYRKITLTGYPLSGKFWNPVVQVYPVQRYVELVPDLAKQVTEMQQVLANHPTEFQNSIPLLPIENAAQVFHAQISYLNFKNGQGVGFLTEYAQFHVPVNNQDLFYTFQGLTSDNKYWISIFLPVNAAYLQPSYDNPTVPVDGIAAPDPSSNNFETEMSAYYASMLQKLNSTAADQFTPSLECIAQFVQSINISN